MALWLVPVDVPKVASGVARSSPHVKPQIVSLTSIGNGVCCRQHDDATTCLPDGVGRETDGAGEERRAIRNFVFYGLYEAIDDTDDKQSGVVASSSDVLLIAWIVLSFGVTLDRSSATRASQANSKSRRTRIEHELLLQNDLRTPTEAATVR